MISEAVDLWFGSDAIGGSARVPRLARSLSQSDTASVQGGGDRPQCHGASELTVQRAPSAAACFFVDTPREPSGFFVGAIADIGDRIVGVLHVDAQVRRDAVAQEPR